MKLPIICIIVVFSGGIQFTSSQVDYYDGLRKFFLGTWRGVTTSGSKLIHMKRIAFYGCLRGSSDFVNASFHFDDVEAEYHFFKRQKFRDERAGLLRENQLSSVFYGGKEFTDADDAIKYEYYCDDTDSERLKDICWYAVNKNSRLRKAVRRTKKFEENPECEFRSVYIKRYQFETKRTLLRCPVIMLQQIGRMKKKKSENDQGSNVDYIYIMSTENAPPGRLMFYLLMPSSGGPRKWPDNASIGQPQAIEYEAPRVNTGNISDLDEGERERSPRLEKGRSSLGSIHEVETPETSSEVDREIEPFQPTEETSGRTAARAPGRTLSVTDYQSSNVNTRFELPRSTRSSIPQFERTRSSFQKSDQPKRRASLPARRYSRTLTRLEPAKQDKSASVDPTYMKINALLMNRRHTSGHHRDESE